MGGQFSRGPVVFLGTSAFAVPGLEALAEAGEAVACVVSQPDRPRGRGRQLEPSPVSAAARRLGLQVLCPEDVNAPEVVSLLAGLAPEFLAVVAYGQLLRSPLLALPRRGAVNLHSSLLPRHRGPSPAAWAILEGDADAGATTMLMDDGLDTGPVLLQASFPLAPDVTRGELEERLATLGADLLVKTLVGVRRGELLPSPQDHGLATWSRKLTRGMRLLDWGRPAGELRRLVHALAPAPAALAVAKGRLVKLLRARETAGVGEPGRVLELGPLGPVVACGGGALVLTEVQPEGRRAMPGSDFARGAHLAPGDRLETPVDG